MGINAYSVPRTPSTGSQFSWRRLLRPHIPHQRDASHLSQDRSRARFFGWHAKFVIPRIREEIETSGFDYRYALNEREEKTIPDRLRARIGETVREDVLHLRCMHYAGSRAFQYEDRWINLASIPKASLQTFAYINPNEWPIGEVPFSDVEVIFSTVNADQMISEILNAP